MVTTIQRVLLVLALSLAPAWAQTNTAAAKPRANRYLLVVETSRAMQRRSEGLWQTVQELVGSGMSGQMRRGDSLGLWTYNERLQTGAFPLQEWPGGAPAGVTARVVDFLKGQAYEKQGHFEAVLPAFQQVVQRSEFLTTVLLLSGEEPVQGIPFAEKINEYCKLWQKQQQEAHMPFVVVLRSQRGKLVDYSLSSPPWPVEFPALPAEVQPPVKKVVEVKKPAPAAAPQPEVKVLPPLILSGKKPEAVPEPEVKVLPPLILSGKKPEAVAAAKPVPAGAEAAVAAARVAEPTPRPRPVVVTQEVVQAAAGSAGGAVSTSAPAPRVVWEPVVRAAPTQSLGPEAPVAAPAGVVAPAATRVETTSAKPVEALPVAAAVSSNAAVPAVPAAAVTPQPGSKGWERIAVWVVGGGILVMSGAGIWVRRGRGRKARHVSLITQSLDRRDR